MSEKETVTEDPKATEPTVEPTTEPATPEPKPEPVVGKSYSQEDVDALLRKAREDEKNKVYGTIEKERKKSEELKAELESNAQKLKELEQSLNQTSDEGKEATTAVTKEVEELRKKNEQLEKAIDTVANRAAEQIREIEVKAYREKRIAEAGIQLPELVTGSTETEIDEAIQRAQDREAKLLTKAREEARLALEQELSDKAPKPVAPANNSRATDPMPSPTDRQNIARLKGEAYEAHRQKLLDEARKRVGLA